MIALTSNVLIVKLYVREREKRKERLDGSVKEDNIKGRRENMKKN